jgi:hypothetical protein
MTKQEAIKWISEIHNGKGVDTTRFPEILKGSLAKEYWYNDLFSYGIEYGVMIALMEAFDIKSNDIG